MGLSSIKITSEVSSWVTLYYYIGGITYQPTQKKKYRYLQILWAIWGMVASMNIRY